MSEKQEIMQEKQLKVELIHAFTQQQYWLDQVINYETVYTVKRQIII